MEGTGRHVTIKTIDKNCRAGYISTQENPAVILGSLAERFQGKCKDPSLATARFLFASHFFPLRSVNTGDPVQQLFIFHLIPSRSSASCQSWHVITTKQDPAFFSFLRGRLRRVLGSTMNYLFARFIGRNTFEFRWMSSIFHAAWPPFTLLPFPARVARTKIRISWLLAMSEEKKPRGGRQCAFSVSPA